MINIINTWAGQIVIAVISVTILEMILPNGNNKKYIKTIIGIYILFVIIYPIINYISEDNLDFEKILESYSYDTEENSKKNNLSIETNAQVEKLYKEEIQKKIEEDIKNKGYITNYFNIKTEFEDEKNYGEIIFLELKLLKEDKTEDIFNTINQIETIKIEIDKKEKTKKTIITEEEIDNLKEFLEENYGISKENIAIKE